MAGMDRAPNCKKGSWFRISSLRGYTLSSTEVLVILRARENWKEPLLDDTCVTALVAV